MPIFLKHSTNRCVQLFVLLLAVAVVYSNSLSGSFHFDDLVEVVNNPATVGLHYTADLGGTRYLPQLSFIVNRALGGTDPFGYHLANLLLHGLMALLVYLLAQALLEAAPQRAGQGVSTGQRTYLPFIAALLFALHPVQTMAVDYVWQRAAILSALFYVAAVLLFIHARGAEGRRRWCGWIASLAAGFLAMKCKENSFTLPFAILLADGFLAPGDRLRNRWMGLSYLLLLPVIPLSHLDLMLETGAGGTRQTLGISRMQYLWTESRVVLTYLRLMFFPLGQNADYDYPVVRSLDAGTMAALAFHAALIGSSVALYLRRTRLHPLLAAAAFGGLWFYLTLAVESSIVPIRDVINEYRLYLPSVGLIFAVLCLAALALSWLQSAASRRAVAVSVTVAFIAGCATLTYARNTVWHDEVSLWTDVVQKSPHKARGHNNLAIAYAAAGRESDALREFETASEDEPGNVTYLLNLADAYDATGQMNAALGVMQRAVTLAPEDAAAHNNLGNLYAQTGAAQSAFGEYARAVQLEPGNALFHANLGAAYQQRGDYADALRELHASTGLDPGNSLAWSNLGAAEQGAGAMDLAMQDYRHALQLDPRNTRALFDYGLAALQLRRYDEACRSFTADLALEPRDPWAQYYVALCKLQAGDKAGALRMLDELAVRAPGVTPAAEMLQRLR